MSPAELAAECVKAINGPRFYSGPPLLTLEGKKTLFPKGGGPKPLRLLCVNSRGNKVWHYNAISVLAALAAHGIVEVRPE